MTELFISFIQAIINRIDIIIGGLIGILGSFVIFWYQTKKAGQIRFDQLRAEKQVNAGQEAYEKLGKIEAMVHQSRPKTTSDQMLKHNKWFSNNRLYLPEEFSEKWEVIRKSLRELKNLDSRYPRDNDKIGELDGLVKKAIEKAKNILHKKFKIKPIKPKSTMPP